jgi:molecular chaperone DnaK
MDIIKKEHDRDVSDDPQAMQRLKEAAEKAKIELSSAQASEINLPFLAEGPLNFEYTMKRAELEKLVGDLIDQTAIPCKAALKDAGLKPSDIDEVVLVGGMTRMPAVQAKVKEIFGKTPLKGVNPDEVVALGASIQGGVLAGDVKQDIVLVDVTPLSLGVETLGGVTTKLIERNTAIPSSKSEEFSTAADNQPSVEVHVLQGEREMSSDNKSLGRFILDGIPPAPRGVPKVEVTFAIDSNGILNVTAKDKGSGKEQSITIKDSGNLNKEDIEKAQKEAEAHAEEDAKKREAVEARNQLANAIYTGEKMKKEHKEKLSEEDVQVIDDAIKEAKDAEDSDDKNVLEKAANVMLEKLQPLGAKMYEEANKQPEDGER